MVKRKLRNFTVFVVFAICAALFSACDTGGNAVSERRITFHLNGGTGTAPSAITQRPGLPVMLPDVTSAGPGGGQRFAGWREYPGSTAGRVFAGRYVKSMPDRHVTMRAQWQGTGADGFVVPAGTLDQQFAWLRTMARSGGNYIVNVPSNTTMGPQMLSFSGVSDVTITLRPTGAGSNISLSSNGALFTIGASIGHPGPGPGPGPGAGVTLVLAGNITLNGRPSNNSALVVVNPGGAFVMNEGVSISGNINTAGQMGSHGGAVRVESGGTFEMRGGRISGNTAWNGGGVWNQGTFRISNGEFFGNTSSAPSMGPIGPPGMGPTDTRGASLFVTSGGTAVRGTFIGAAFNQLGALSTTSANPLVVANGLIEIQGATLNAQLAWLRDNAGRTGVYVIEVGVNETITPTTFDTGTGQMLPTGRDNITITLRGVGAMRTISLGTTSFPGMMPPTPGTGSHFWIPSGVTLVLDNNITLQGSMNNTNHLVRVNSGGNFVMNEGSRITGNRNTTSTDANGGGAVRVNSGGTFTMNGGEISGNSTTHTGTWSSDPGHGGGVRVQSGGTFNMRGGTISGNEGQNGGGVWNQGAFRVSNGAIFGNISRGTGASLNHTGGMMGNMSQRGTFITSPGGALVFSMLGTLFTTETDMYIVNGILQTRGIFSISLAHFQNMAPDIPIAGPVISMVSGSEHNPARLSANAWASGDITQSNGEVWFSLEVVAGNTYNLWWNHWWAGDGTKTMDGLSVAVYNPDGTWFSSWAVSDGWYSHWSFTAAQTGTVRIGVSGWNWWDTGTFGIVYSTGTVRPVVRPSAPVQSVPFTPSAITVSNPEDFDYGSIRWIFQGRQITGDMISGTYGETINLRPRIHDEGLGLGTHFLTVEVSVNGVRFDRQITFTVER